MTTFIKKHKPTSPGQRGKVSIVHDHLYKGRPLAKLIDRDHKSAFGRNNNGRITTRHKSGPLSNRRLYRLVDFKRNNKDGVPAKVARIEYCPYRTAHLALLSYADGDWAYIVAPHGTMPGDAIMSGDAAPIERGNCMPLSSIPQGTTIHAVEMKPGKGAQLARSAGTYVTLVAKDGAYAILRLRSGEVRKVLLKCRATLGEVSNPKHNLIKKGKAGVSRHQGIRPTVRGVAMNPIDHPHGGGEGRTSGGRHPCSPTGLQTKGKKTRSCKRTDHLIVKRRSKKKRR